MQLLQQELFHVKLGEREAQLGRHERVGEEKPCQTSVDESAPLHEQASLPGQTVKDGRVKFEGNDD